MKGPLRRAARLSNFGQFVPEVNGRRSGTARESNNFGEGGELHVYLKT